MCTTSSTILPISDTPTKLLKHFISTTFTFILSELLMPHAYNPYNAVGTIINSYRHIFAFRIIPRFIPLIQSVYHIPYTSAIQCHLRCQVLETILISTSLELYFNLHSLTTFFFCILCKLTRQPTHSDLATSAVSPVNNSCSLSQNCHRPHHFPTPSALTSFINIKQP